ncbi:MAG: hypothetical protein ACK55R_01675 [Cyanobacteriota bacterium]|jgi:hypothetical protein
MTSHSTTISFVAIGISLVALATTILNFRRKSNISISGSIVYSLGSPTSNAYVSKIFLDNKKDRAVTIYAVYLMILPNYYIQLEDLEGDPLTLAPYSSVVREYGQVHFYSINLKRIDLNNLFELKKDNRTSKRKKFIVLATSDGKYVVKNSIKRWSPVGLFFRNHLTAIIQPRTVKYKDQFVDSRAKFLVLLNYKDSEQILMIRPDEYKYIQFKGFQLSESDLKDMETIKKFFELQRSKGNINFDSVEVLDPSKLVEVPDRVLKAPEISWLEYNLTGLVKTWISNKMLDYANKKRKFKA